MLIIKVIIISWVASRTKISPPTGQVLFERVVGGIRNAY